MEIGVPVTVMLNTRVAVLAGLLVSLACAVKSNVPTAPGVPAMTPLVGSSVRPGGSDPLTTDQMYGGVPPLAVNVAV